MRTYFETLLHRKRGEYGPLWLFELDSETWAIVWEECLDDEDTCRLILLEDPSWFNREWHKDGRRPNPTYRTPRQALEEIIRSLQAMKETFDSGDVMRSHYSAYAALAEYHLHTMEAGERTPPLRAGELSIPDEGAPAEPFEAARLVEAILPPAEPEKAPSALASKSAETKKPWEVISSEPTASNFRPDLPLHAKMEWVCNNVPRMSRLRILRDGAELLCNRLIEKYTKDN